MAERELVLGTRGQALAVAANADPASYASVLPDLMPALGRAAQFRVVLTLLGETGTGKSTLARRLHELSPWRTGPFCVLNCGGIPGELFDSALVGHEKGAFSGADARRPGIFEQALGGTAFLDEIGEIPLDRQVKLLHALDGDIRRVGGTESFKVDCRIIVATNQDLEALVRAGKLREDLYWRICRHVFHVPPLRERPADIEQLARHFAASKGRQLFGRPAQLTAAAIAKLQELSWPGNARELEACIERSLVHWSGEGTLGPGDLVFMLQAPSPLKVWCELDLHIQAHGPGCGWRLALLARALDVSQATVSTHISQNPELRRLRAEYKRRRA